MPIQQMFLGIPAPASAGGGSVSAVSFDGNGDYLEVAKSTDFDFGTGAFTIEAWVYANSLVTDTSQHGGLDCIFESIDWGSQLGQYSFGISGANKVYFYLFNNANTYYYGTTTLATQQWYHLAVSRDGSGNIRLFVDGARESSDNNSFSLSNSGQPNPARIGGSKIGFPGTGINKSFDGYISNLRVLKGKALYESDFVEPNQQLENITNTVLLCCNGSSATDATVIPTSITVNGDAASQGTVVPSSWDGGYGSVLFDGNGDSISHAATGDYNLDGDWCIECWVNSTDVSLSGGLYKRVWSLASTSDNTNTLFNGLCGSWEDDFSVGGDGRFKLRIDDNVTLQSSSIASDGNWHHFVIQRGGSTISLHVDGVLEASTSYSSNVNYSVNTFKIGEHHVNMNGVPGYYSSFPGKISNFRFVNGSSVYPLGASFTVPTSPLKAITNTVLLSCNDPSNAESGTAGPVASIGGNAVHNTSHPF